MEDGRWKMEDWKIGRLEDWKMEGRRKRVVKGLKVGVGVGSRIKM